MPEKLVTPKLYWLYSSTVALTSPQHAETLCSVDLHSVLLTGYITLTVWVTSQANIFTMATVVSVGVITAVNQPLFRRGTSNIIQ